jgi:hypothetical protein
MPGFNWSKYNLNDDLLFVRLLKSCDGLLDKEQTDKAMRAKWTPGKTPKPPTCDGHGGTIMHTLDNAPPATIHQGAVKPPIPKPKPGEKAPKKPEDQSFDPETLKSFKVFDDYLDNLIKQNNAGIKSASGRPMFDAEYIKDLQTKIDKLKAQIPEGGKRNPELQAQINELDYSPELEVDDPLYRGEYDPENDWIDEENPNIEKWFSSDNFRPRAREDDIEFEDEGGDEFDLEKSALRMQYIQKFCKEMVQLTSSARWNSVPQILKIFERETRKPENASAARYKAISSLLKAGLTEDQAMKLIDIFTNKADDSVTAPAIPGAEDDDWNASSPGLETSTEGDSWNSSIEDDDWNAAGAGLESSTDGKDWEGDIPASDLEELEKEFSK